MMHYVVTSIKIDIFMFVTTRPIAHSGQFVCIRNCVREFSTDTGQSLVTSNVMPNHLSDHHKAYYTYIEHTQDVLYASQIVLVSLAQILGSPW